MKNVKDQVANALATVTENVSDAYPSNWSDFPAIQYAEENNFVKERTDDGQETMAQVRYRVDIWDNKSTSETAIAVDKAVSSLGLVRTLCQDVADPTGLKHKVMRYEGIIDMVNDYVYWNN